MKKSFVLFLAAAFLAACAGLRAAETEHHAKVLKISGAAAQVQLPGGETKSLQVGDLLPQGATILTGPGTEVHIAPFAGAVSTIKENSSVGLEQLSLTTEGATVTKQNALLNLKTGNLISTLDPTKKNINNYGVRTPKGVAAARGTTFSVTVGDQVYMLSLEGGVTLTPVGGGPSITITPGGISVGGAEQTSLAALAADPATQAVAAQMNELAAVTVAAVAAIAASPATFGVDSATITTQLMDTVTNVVAQVPAAANQAVASAAAAAPALASQLATTAVNAAVNSATPDMVAGLTQSIAQGAASTATSATAAAAIAQSVAGAAAAAAPDQANAIAQASAQGVSLGASAAVRADPAFTQAVSNSAQSGASSAPGVPAGAVTAPTVTETPTITTPQPIDPSTVVVSPST